MNNYKEIYMRGVVGSGLCVASDDGQKIYEEIEKAFKAGKKVKLSFDGVDDLTSAFLNSAIGQLYGKFSEQEIKEKLSISEGTATQENLVLLKRVVDRAKEFFKDSRRFESVAREIIGEN